MRLWSTAAGLCLVFLACSARGLRWDVDLKTEMTGNLFPQAAKLRSSASGEFLLRSTPMDGVGVGAVWLVTPRESAGLDPLFVAVANTSEPFQLIDLNHDAIDDFVYTSNAQASHLFFVEGVKGMNRFSSEVVAYRCTSCTISLCGVVDVDRDGHDDLLICVRNSECTEQSVLWFSGTSSGVVNSTVISHETLFSYDTTTWLIPCSELVFGAGQLASGAPAITSLWAEEKCRLVLPSANANGTVVISTVPLAYCPDNKGSSRSWAAFVAEPNGTVAIAVQETLGLNAEGTGASGRYVSLVSFSEGSNETSLVHTSLFSMDSLDPALFFILNDTSGPVLMLFGLESGIVSTCGNLLSPMDGICSKKLDSAYAVSALALEGGEQHQGSDVFVVFERRRRDLYPKVAWLNDYLSPARDKSLYLEILRFYNAADIYSSNFWAAMGVGLGVSALLVGVMLLLFVMDNGEDVRVQLDGEIEPPTPHNEEIIFEGMHKRRVMAHVAVGVVLVLISAVSPAWTTNPLTVFEVITVPSLALLLIVVLPLDIKLIISSRKGPQSGTLWHTVFLVVCAVLLAATVVVLSIGLLYETAAIVFGCLWGLMIVMLFLLVSFDLAVVQKYVPANAETLINRHFKRYEKFYQKALWVMLLVGAVLVSAGAPLEFVVMHGGMSTLALAFSTLIVSLPTILAKDVAITRSFTIVQMVLAAFTMITSIVTTALTWPRCQNELHACPSPAAFVLGVFPLCLSLLGIFAMALREVLIVGGFRSVLLRTVGYTIPWRRHPVNLANQRQPQQEAP